MITSRTLTALEFPKLLEHLADRCLSPSGKTAVLELRPFSTAQEATHAALLYSECRTWYGVAESASGADKKAFRMVNFPDISGVMPFLRAPFAILDLDGLWTLREVLRLAEAAAQSVQSFVYACTSLNPIAQAANAPSPVDLVSPNGGTCPRLLALIKSCPLPETLTKALVRCLNDDGHIRDESSPELLLVRTELRRLHQNCLRRVKDFASEYNIAHYLQDSFMSLASDRYVLPLKSNFKGRLQGIIHDYSQTGETCYFEPMFLVEVNNSLQELKRQEREEERKILEFLTNLTREALSEVQNALHLLTRLDVLIALQKLAQSMEITTQTTLKHGVRHKNTAKKATAPGECQLVDLYAEDAHSDIYLPDARHPLLALGGSAQPINLILEKDELGLVISGGNAGGKTVCLKTLGLLVLMSMCGFPVPVGLGARLPAFTHLYAFIGDAQSLEDHLSTFTGQIRQLAQAWDTANKHCLILLDEFGAGTDPAQGAALAQAVLDGLLDKGATVMAATHFPALKTYALSRDKARAASVLFDPNTKRPLFCLAYDQVGASQALDVAREHGLPESILRRAEHYLLMDGEDTGALIERLNGLAVRKEEEINALKQEHQEQKRKNEQLLRKLEQERSKLYAEVKQRAAELLQAWKAGKVTHKQALKNMSLLRAELAEKSGTQTAAEGGAQTTIDALRVGSEVMHRVFGKKGKICQIDTRKQRAQLHMNGVTLWADLKDLNVTSQTVGEKSAAHSPKSGSVLTRLDTKGQGSGTFGTLLSLDMRGQRADVALSQLSAFLDKAIMNSRESVEIVHGRGTGVLRKEVHNFLRTFPGIEHFELAPEDRGGDGMTIVYLR